MHAKDPQLSVVRVGHRVPLMDFCLSLDGMHVLDRDVKPAQWASYYKGWSKMTKFYYSYLNFPKIILNKYHFFSIILCYSQSMKIFVETWTYKTDQNAFLKDLFMLIQYTGNAG